ncbi:hypothetical protein Pst134EA_030644 [Puccinia striiformis f. sp. tritici]|uniref:hypothetical protein n=1 Tax=Puccinia striiformis f. sp. tritici TaxID=168172 RepID=UPI0020080574|nr:hypothetical protein Pst134EA_030644 [Puccinia striiformis f. sp. tritici]KAH9446738.1 hypothetical protein Pst134EA_030644 [Puccinia striiformis f. sp. tritici]
MQKTGQLEKTTDREFQDHEVKFKTMEKNSLTLQKEAKAYLDSMRGKSYRSTKLRTEVSQQLFSLSGLIAMTSAQTRVGETIDNFYGDSSEASIASNSYKRAVEELDEIAIRELDTPYRTTVLEPVGRFCSYFTEVNNTLAKRHKKLLDYDAARTKVRKLAEKPSDDPSKLIRAEKECDEAKQIFKVYNDSLTKELPEIVDLRIPYLDPCFEAMVRLQLSFHESGYDKLGGVQRYFSESVRDDYANGQLDNQVETALQEMRELAICGLP